MENQQLWALIELWKAFFGCEASAAATLLGLLFVAISLNADLILAGDRPHTTLLAEQAFQNYVAVFFIAVSFLIPELRAVDLSISLAIESIVLIGWSIIRLMKSLRSTEASMPKWRAWARLTPSLLCYSLINYEVNSHSTLSQANMLGICGATLVLLMSATRTAWDLLVRVAAARHSPSARD